MSNPLTQLRWDFLTRLLQVLRDLAQGRVAGGTILFARGVQGLLDHVIEKLERIITSKMVGCGTVQEQTGSLYRQLVNRHRLRSPKPTEEILHYLHREIVCGLLVMGLDAFKWLEIRWMPQRRCVSKGDYRRE